MPLTSAHACSCGFAGYPEAIADADFAFVGTVVRADEPERPTGFDEAAYTFDIALSKEPMQSPFTVLALHGNGANCGIDMGLGEEWLVIASIEDGRPRTHLCTGSSPVAGLDPAVIAQAADLLTVEPAGTPPDRGETDAPEAVPAPSTTADAAVDVRLLVAGAVAAGAAVGLAAGVALARRRPGSGAGAS